MKFRVNMGEMIQFLPADVKEAFHAAAKSAGKKTDDLELFRKAHSEKAQVNQLDKKSRKALKYVSTRSVDRDAEIVIPEMMDLTEFKKYGHVLVNHNYSLLPIGSDESIEPDDWGIKAMTNHADTGEGTLANVVWALVEQGHLKASSIGFVPIEATAPGDHNWDAVANKLARKWKEFNKAAAEQGGVTRIITRGILLEHSYVSVPCNPDAELIQVVKGMNIKDKNIFKGLGWQAETEEGILVPKREVITIKSEGTAPIVSDEGKKPPMKACEECGKMTPAPKEGKVICPDCAKKEEEKAKKSNPPPVKKGLGNRSVDELRNELHRLMNEASSGDKDSGISPVGGYVMDIFESYFVFSRYANGKDLTFRQTYMVGEDGAVSLIGDPIQVERRVQYLPIKGEKGIEAPAPKREPVIKAIKPPPVIKVVSTPISPDAIQKTIQETTERTLARRLGKIS